MKILSLKDKILLVVNPIAGGTDKTEAIEIVKTSLESKYNLEIYNTTGNNDKAVIEDLIENTDPVRILVMGGDGTVKLVAQIVTDKIPIGILPAGSANGLATDLELPTDLEEAISRATGNNIRCIDTLKINDQLGLHISDIGLNAELIKEFSNGKLRGHFGYALNVIPTIVKSDMPYKFNISANNKENNFEAVMVAFANSQRFGTGVTINPNGVLDDGFFEVLVFKNLDPLSVTKTLMGKIPIDSEFVEVIKTKEVTVTCDNPISFQIDGEPCDKQRKVQVTILPKNICIAV